MHAVDLDTVADKLYGLPPGEFTAARDRLAREARAGDRALADGIGSLRRPNLAAWALNVFAREHADELAALLGLGEQLRQAQSSLAGDELRALLADRRQLLSAMLGEIRRMALDHGQRLSDQVMSEVHQSLDAALADPGAAEQVRSGRLTAGLSHVGLASGERAAGERPAGGREQLRQREEADREQARREEAEHKLAEAEGALEAARSELEAAERAADVAAGEVSRARRRVEELEDELAKARRELSSAERAARDADAGVSSARRRRGEAETEAERARRELDRLSRR